MDELLTDLKSYDKHKAFTHEARAGRRLQGEVEAERSSKLFWVGGDAQARADSSGFSLRGEGKAFKRRDVVRSVFPSKGREPSLSWTAGGKRRRKRAKSSLNSSGEARSSGAALGGGSVMGPKWFPPVGSGQRESASAGAAGDGSGIVSGSCSPGCGCPGGWCVCRGRESRQDFLSAALAPGLITNQAV